MSEDPPGRLSPRSHRLTSPDVTLRALRAEDIHHRRTADPVLVFRRLLSLDYVLEHLGLKWLATEPEKVCYATSANETTSMPVPSVSLATSTRCG